MEVKLAAYRKKKRKEAMVNKIKEVLSWERNNMSNTDDKDDLESIISEDSMDFTPPAPNLFFTWSMCCLYLLLWSTVYVISIQLEFGTVYLMISVLVFIYYNTRSGPKKKGEISAYSVFNPNCEPIDGTLKPEQFEQEIRFGAASVH